MGVEVKPGVSLVGRQPDGSIVVWGLNKFHSSKTSMEFREDGFDYYLGSPNEVTSWLNEIVSFVRFTEEEKEAQRAGVLKGIEALHASERVKPRFALPLKIGFSYTDAHPFSNPDILRFNNQAALNQTFTQILPFGSVNGWSMHFGEFYRSLEQTVAPSEAAVA